MYQESRKTPLILGALLIGVFVLDICTFYLFEARLLWSASALLLAAAFPPHTLKYLVACAIPLVLEALLFDGAGWVDIIGTALLIPSTIFLNTRFHIPPITASLIFTLYLSIKMWHGALPLPTAHQGAFILLIIGVNLGVMRLISLILRGCGDRGDRS